MRILVVDDKFDSRWAVADWLVGFFDAVKVESAASGSEALATVETRRPDLVLAAHPMPEMDGIELARRIKSEPNAPLVVILTAKSDAQFELACGASGADFWLEAHHLQARLLAFLQRRFSLRVRPTRPLA